MDKLQHNGPAVPLLLPPTLPPPREIGAQGKCRLSDVVLGQITTLQNWKYSPAATVGADWRPPLLAQFSRTYKKRKEDIVAQPAADVLTVFIFIFSFNLESIWKYIVERQLFGYSFLQEGNILVALCRLAEIWRNPALLHPTRAN